MMAEPVAAEFEREIELTPAEEIPPPAKQPTLADEQVSSPLTRQFTMEAYEPELFYEAPQITADTAAGDGVVEIPVDSTPVIEPVLPATESVVMQFVETIPTVVSTDIEPAVDIDKAVVRGDITVELELPETETTEAVPEEPVSYTHLTLPTNREV